MTKEELEKEAREKFRQKYNCYPRNKSWFTEGYLASAEPREKRIAELEKENLVLHEMNVKRIKYYNLLTKAKELLKKWLQTSKASGCDNINILTDTEQFLSEVEK